MKTKIIFYITHYQPIYTGAGKSLEKLINILDKDKFEIEILTCHQKGLQKIEYKNNYKIVRKGGYFFNNTGYLNIIGKLYFSISSTMHILKNRDFDIINFIGIGNISLPTILVIKLLNKKIVNKITAVGDDDPKKLSQSIIGRYILKLLRKDTFHWIISKEIYNNCLKYSSWNKNNLFLITNPVKVKYKNYKDLLNIRKELKTKEIIFLFVGVLDKRKGVDVLLELWNKYNINAKLLLCGPRGKDENINQILETNINNNIIELGQKKFEEIEKLYLSSNYFIFPSRREGLPNVVLEAMSYGLPVVANQIDGVTDFLLGDNNQRGIVIKNNDIQQWIDVIELLLKDNNKMIEQSKNAFEWILNNAEESVVKNKIQNMYISLLKV